MSEASVPKDPKGPAPALRVGCSVAILFAAGLIAVGLVKTKPKPSAATPIVPRLAVRLQTATATNLNVRIEAFGEVRALRVAEISAELSGLVLDMPRIWQAGDLVKAGETLVALDDRDYRAAVNEANAQLAQATAARAQLESQHGADLSRLPLAERTRDLARAEFERVRELFASQKIGSASGVEAAEQAYNQAETQWLTVKQAVDLHPARLLESDANLQAARSRVERASTALDRCVIRAPFDGRVTFAAVQIGQFANAGRHLLTLADDSELELRVPVDAADLRQWLPFEAAPVTAAWFPPLPPLPVELAWTESAQSLAWTGTLHRVVSFDPGTRTATVAVRVSAEQALAGGHPLPLSAGMFCRAILPGRAMRGVFPLPRAAVGFDGQVYLADEGVLRSARVRVLRTEGDTAYIDQGLREGEQVIVTRLVAPLEGALLNVLEN